MNTKPLVSLCCTTYNHAPYIRKCLDGFLMQKTSFPIEILIYDDCSTDGNQEIIKEYEAKYPDLIFPIYATENQFSKGVVVDFFSYRRARGKYITMCEGDDYWTDPLKLQKQVDFMEANPEYSVCFHSLTNYNVYTGEYFETTPTKLMRERNAVEGMDIDMDTYFSVWCTQPMTMMFRVSDFRFEWAEKYHGYRDVHETYHLLKMGKCRLMNFDGGIHNMHNGGIATNLKITESIQINIDISKELYFHNLDKATKNNLISAYGWKLRYTRPLSLARVICATKIFNLNHNIWLYIKNIVRRNE